MINFFGDKMNALYHHEHIDYFHGIDAHKMNEMTFEAVLIFFITWWFMPS
jgi:hypothetical protein